MEFNLLPPEIQLEIFSYLPILQVMKIRKVCKHWNALINAEFRIKGLQGQHEPAGGPPQSLLGFLCLRFLSIRSFFDRTRDNPMFSRVKFFSVHLCLNYAELNDAFDLLNSFRALERTSFDCYVSDLNRINLGAIEKKQFVVSLDRLKDAYFTFNLDEEDEETEAFISKVNIVLDLRSLLYLQVDSLRGLTIKYPERLRTLVTERLFGATWDYSKFTNLTKIRTLTRDRPSITASFLEKLPSLRELHLDDEFCDELGGRSLDPLEPPPSSKAALRILYLGFEFSSKEISNSNQWPEFVSPEGSTFIARNLHKSIDNNRQVFFIDYNAIVGELNDAQMFGVMPRKLPKILRLRIFGTVTDPNRLLKFISQFPMECLEFERTSLPQWFFEKLHESAPLMQELWIGTEPTISILPGDFDFVFKFENLFSLNFEDHPLPLNFVTRLLKRPNPESDVWFEQAGSYSFWLYPFEDGWEIALRVNVDGIDEEFSYEFSRDEAVELANELNGQLKADGFVNPKEFLVLLQQLRFEKQNALFWMRKLIYEQRHSIVLSKEQWRLLNIPG